jgi:hypothetical protein
MRAILVALVAAASCSPVFAQGCKFVSGFDLGAVVEVSATEAIFLDTDGSERPCTVMWGDEGGNVLDCEGLGEMQFALVPSTANGPEADLLIMHNGPWYRECPLAE